MKRARGLLGETAVPLAVGAVVLAGVTFGAHAGTGSLLLALCASAVLSARRLAPTTTLALSGGLVLLLFHLNQVAGAASVLAPAVALYSLASTRGRVYQLSAALVAVAAIVLSESLFDDPQDAKHQTIANIALLALPLVAVPLLAGEAVRNRRAYVALLLDRAELAEHTAETEAQRRVEQERLRIARDLHDVVAHTLTTINVQAGVAAHLLDGGPGHARASLTSIAEASHEALDELRAVVGVLREHDVTAVPMEPTPTLEAVGSLVQRARDGGRDVRLDISGEQPGRLPDAVSLAAFRIVQESLTNIQRHAGDAAARISLVYEPDHLRLAIENSPGASTNGAGLGVGIIGMKERAATVGGTLHAAPGPDGFRVAAELPYRRSP